MTERRLAKPKVLAMLAAIQVADAAACLGPIKPVKDSLEKVGLPQRIWWVLPVVKSASAVGLIGGIWSAALGRLTAFMLAVYFTLAVGAHVRARDSVFHALPAVGLLVWFAVLAGKGFDERDSART
ncbi:MAG: DoxX family protein [Mycobacterium sp.]